ncbi:MAG: hypothetical protein J5680_05425 [Neisseriaceae bacterium]|nr:hypothetical protein [Neisseriaceae bacterium]
MSNFRQPERFLGCLKVFFFIKIPKINRYLVVFSAMIDSFTDNHRYLIEHIVFNLLNTIYIFNEKHSY